MRTKEEKVSIAKGWVEARRQGMTQAQYARSVGLGGERTLRSYLKLYSPTMPSLEQVRAELVRMQEDIGNLLDRLDAASLTVTTNAAASIAGTVDARDARPASLPVAGVKVQPTLKRIATAGRAFPKPRTFSWSD